MTIIADLSDRVIEQVRLTNEVTMTVRAASSVKRAPACTTSLPNAFLLSPCRGSNSPGDCKRRGEGWALHSAGRRAPTEPAFLFVGQPEKLDEAQRQELALIT